jgi:hypothetical protein
MDFWLFRKKVEINKTEQIRERARLLNIVVKGCSSHPAYEGDGPALGICRNCSDLREAYLALQNLNKRV